MKPSIKSNKNTPKFWEYHDLDQSFMHRLEEVQLDFSHVEEAFYTDLSQVFDVVEESRRPSKEFIRQGIAHHALHYFDDVEWHQEQGVTISEFLWHHFLHDIEAHFLAGVPVKKRVKRLKRAYAKLSDEMRDVYSHVRLVSGNAVGVSRVDALKASQLFVQELAIV